MFSKKVQIEFRNGVGIICEKNVDFSVAVTFTVVAVTFTVVATIFIATRAIATLLNPHSLVG
ncbi:MAG: hypothetical protein F6K35_25685 [Okeania sp. SIO2H7]|nr:hypothetical protein [Okeania sp. SIO2H7]